jgi:competence ComEA-like helix-hairpin-helix protein
MPREWEPGWTTAAGGGALELNATERKVLWRAAAIVVAGAGLRVALAPDPAELRWIPGDTGAAITDRVSLDSQRRAVAEAVRLEERASRPLAPGERLPLNEVPAVELQRLPGIGPALSARIVEERRRRGGFLRVEELREVRGIGPTVLERIRPHLQVP